MSAVSDFLAALDDHIVIGDGALGTRIYACGIPLGRSCDEINLTQPDLVRAIHREYLQAGAEILETNTFTANRLRLERFKLGAKTRPINLAGARLARKVAGRGAFVAGSVGPLAGIRRGKEAPPSDEKFDVFCEQCFALAEGGCDALILETFTDLEDLGIALRAARTTALPVICQMAFVEKLRIPLDVSVDQAVRAMEAAGADVIGANCTVPYWTVRTLQRMAGIARSRLSAFPNAGLPGFVDGRAIYPTTPDTFAAMGRKLAEAGATLIGGCCGTGPEQVRALADGLKGKRPSRASRPGSRSGSLPGGRKAAGP